MRLRCAREYLSSSRHKILFLLPPQISPLTFRQHTNPSLHPSPGNAAAITLREKIRPRTPGAKLVDRSIPLTCVQTNSHHNLSRSSTIMPPIGSPLLKRCKLTHNVGITPAAPKPKSLLDVKCALLIAQVRFNVYEKMVEIESTNRGFERDHHGRFVCPVDATGLAPYLNHPMTKVSGLRQEYLVEVCKLVVFVFTSSDHLKLFSEFIRSHFNLDPAQVPHLQAKVNFFHNDSFPQGDILLQ
ncbi:hypothetical protein FGADI_9291 [Fusarium gaditjirri]|uniref:Uncharacterized protein n=1 Tax=Fusarium gaditjirri TaxID=282569 RepID=A0A8H4WT45_9HYPO|nr:hypothetical protein FGADI_9291 [Fusarium gaditjirri]